MPTLRANIRRCIASKPCSYMSCIAADRIRSGVPARSEPAVTPGLIVRLVQRGEDRWFMFLSSRNSTSHHALGPRSLSLELETSNLPEARNTLTRTPLVTDSPSLVSLALIGLPPSFVTHGSNRVPVCGLAHISPIRTLSWAESQSCVSRYPTISDYRCPGDVRCFFGG